MSKSCMIILTPRVVVKSNTIIIKAHFYITKYNYDFKLFQTHTLSSVEDQSRVSTPFFETRFLRQAGSEYSFVKLRTITIQSIHTNI